MATKLESTHLDRFKLKNCSLNTASTEILHNYLGSGSFMIEFLVKSFKMLSLMLTSVQTVTVEKLPF